MLPINPEVFKAYDIRGIYGQDFDNELGRLLGVAYVELRKNDPDYTPGKKLKIAVAADMRLSSPGLKDSLIRGITEAGADVVDLGTISTPTMYFAVGHYGYDGGITVSASHNPKEWNGFKLVRAKGVPISGETGIDYLKDKVLENHFLPAETRGEILKNDGALTDEIAYALSFADNSKIKPLKVVVDTANGMGATYINALFAKLPCELIPMNFSLDGSFPAHEADPIKEENLVQLQAEVKAKKADLGIAIDGDGDRMFFIDNEGQVINQAIIRGLLAKLFLEIKPGARIGYDVRPGRITIDLIKENGGVPVMTRVGHSLIKEQMLKEDIFFAGESSGHFYLRGEAGCFEYPSVIVLKLLTLVSSAPQGIAAYVAPFNKYFNSGEINRVVGDKKSVFDNISAKYAEGQISYLDGITIEYPDFWFNVRGSNTEPKVRLNLEAVDQATMEKRRDEILALMQ
ncbi:MAG: phosphomannomutase/phosphoglucomutase [Patescibacteria group bacterium]|jgi:phosphomannomutase